MEENHDLLIRIEGMLPKNQARLFEKEIREKGRDNGKVIDWNFPEREKLLFTYLKNWLNETMHLKCQVHPIVKLVIPSLGNKEIYVLDSKLIV